MSRRNNNRRKENSNSPAAVKEFAEASLKEFKKENKYLYDGKKEMKAGYYDMLLFDLPAVTDWLLRNGHIQKPEVQQLKDACLEKFVKEDEGPAFIKYISKHIEHYGVEDIPDIEFFPIILQQIIRDITSFNDKMKEENPSELITPPDDLYDLCKQILKKRLKKAKKKGLDEGLAFDLLGIMPCKEATKYAPFVRTRQVFDILYYYAGNTTALNFGQVIEFLYKENDYRYVIGYALQEKKDKYHGFNEGQKKLFNDINEFIFGALEELPKEDIRDIIMNYIKVRQRDDAAGKDANRRYYLTSLPSSIYPKIVKVVDEIKGQNGSLEKYL